MKNKIQIDENEVIGYQEENGKYVVYIKDCPKIIGRGDTPEQALEDLVDTYRSIIKTVHKIVRDNATSYCG